MAYLGKEFKLVKQEKYEELIESFGYPKEIKEQIINSKSNAKLVKNSDGSYTLSSISANGNSKDIKFKIGEELEDTFFDTMKVKFVFTVDGDTFIQVLKMEGGKEMTAKRHFSDSELVMTITSNNYSGEAKRYYKA